jgi:hypothetical protein
VLVIGEGVVQRAALLRLQVRIALDDRAQRQHIERIEPDATVTWTGTRHDSLSTAAGMARKSVVGAPEVRKYPQANGWTLSRFRDADGGLTIIDVLRQRHAS